MTEPPAQQQSSIPDHKTGILLGLLSDTHGVYDRAAAAALKGAHLLLHAGDVGHHGGHAEVLKAFADATCSPVLAVSGNVDDAPGAAQLLPPHRILVAAGWKVLLVHIVAPGPGSKGVCSVCSLC
jgi:predicted phosphodiesterase